MNLKCFGCGRAGHLQRDCKTKKPGIAGTTLEEEPASEKCSVAQMRPQDVNPTNRNILLQWDYVMDTSRFINLSLDVSVWVIENII